MLSKKTHPTITSSPAALAGNANLIVSHDLDLLRLKTFETIGIITPIDFLNTLTESKKAA
jgi:predicted nucleic acid-binding protein